MLILSGDHIYEMDYDVLIQFHREKERRRDDLHDPRADG